MINEINLFIIFNFNFIIFLIEYVFNEKNFFYLIEYIVYEKKKLKKSNIIK